MMRTKRSTSRENAATLFVVYGFMGVMFVLSELISPGFLAVRNLSNILRQSAFLGMIAAGQTLVILTAGTDLSVSYLATLGNVLAAQILSSSDSNIPMALIVVVAVGAITGLVNGVGVHFLRIPSLIMTLGVGSVLQGIVYLYTKGAPKGNTSPLIKTIVSGNSLGPFPPLVFIWLVMAVGMVFLLRRTVFGRNVYSIGENPLAARYAGIPVGRTLLTVYVISGILSCVTGMLLVGYTGTSYLDVGTDYQMNSIAAVVIGGTYLSGGRGGYGGTIAGSIIMCVLLSILNIIQLPAFGRSIVRGAIILVLLIAFGLQNKKRLAGRKLHGPHGN